MRLGLLVIGSFTLASMFTAGCKARNSAATLKDAESEFSLDELLQGLESATTTLAKEAPGPVVKPAKVEGLALTDENQPNAANAPNARSVSAEADGLLTEVKSFMAAPNLSAKQVNAAKGVVERLQTLVDRSSAEQIEDWKYAEIMVALRKVRVVLSKNARFSGELRELACIVKGKDEYVLFPIDEATYKASGLSGLLISENPEHYLFETKYFRENGDPTFEVANGRMTIKSATEGKVTARITGGSGSLSYGPSTFDGCVVRPLSHATAKSIVRERFRKLEPAGGSGFAYYSSGMVLICDLPDASTPTRFTISPIGEDRIREIGGVMVSATAKKPNDPHARSWDPESDPRPEYWLAGEATFTPLDLAKSKLGPPGEMTLVTTDNRAWSFKPEGNRYVFDAKASLGSTVRMENCEFKGSPPGFAVNSLAEYLIRTGGMALGDDDRS